MSEYINTAYCGNAKTRPSAETQHLGEKLGIDYNNLFNTGKKSVGAAVAALCNNDPENMVIVSRTLHNGEPKNLPENAINYYTKATNKWLETNQPTGNVALVYNGKTITDIYSSDTSLDADTKPFDANKAIDAATGMRVVVLVASFSTRSNRDSVASSTSDDLFALFA